MKHTLNAILFSILFLAISCKENPKSESADQMEEVMAIHDEVMPKMGTIGKLVGELKGRVDSTETGQQYEEAMQDLQQAHEAMMVWMQEFGNRFDSEEILEGKALSDEKKKWLEEEEEKVKDVREKINSSIEKAEAILED